MSSQKVILKVTSGPHTGRTFVYDNQDSLLVGRSGQAQLLLEGDQHISRNHCLIEVRPPECHVVDLDSANGTFVNERRVSDCWLKDGDTIRGGQTRISVRVKSSETAALVVGNDPQDLAATFIPAKLEEVVGSYRVQEKIGSGSMGLVHRAQHVDTGQFVALKILSPELSMTDALQQSFIREAGILCRLSHKRIVQ